MEHDNKNIRRQYGILFIFPYISWLLFFPSINFGLYEAEIFPWALLISVVFIERYNKILLIAVLYLSLSAVMAMLIYESYFESIRSLAAYLNALLAFSLIFSLPTPCIIKLTKQVRKVFVVLLVLGLLQYLQIINFIDPVLKFLVPRADSSSLDYMNRGVTLLASEPARAGVEFVFIYMVLRVSIREMAETMREVVGYKGKLAFDTTKPDGAPRKLIDVSRLSNMGWKYSVDLKDGLSKTYKWYLKN